MRLRHVLVAAALSSIALVALPRARAEMWCADALWVHEWGVQVFGADGRTRAQIEMPSYFHRSGPAGAPTGTHVRELPPDSGERELPIVHFYSSGAWSSGAIPVAIAVGFTRGDATRWFPQVDVRRPAAQANGASGTEGRRRVLAARRALTPRGNRGTIEADPSRQLEWARLSLTREAQHTPPASSTAWVRDMRAFGDALWVNNDVESERFVFYEGATSERALISIARGDQWRAGRRHYVLRNESSHPVHDVFVVHREANDVFVFFAPQIPARRTAGFVLEEHRSTNVAAATRDHLRQSLLDAREPAPPARYSWAGNCVMGRDPAQPVEAADGHALYAHEVDAILRVWGARFFDGQGTRVLYREDVRYLDEMMPLSVYTDMYHFPLVRRAGLALWENVALP